MIGTTRAMIGTTLQNSKILAPHCSTVFLQTLQVHWQLTEWRGSKRWFDMMALRGNMIERLFHGNKKAILYENEGRN
jgi:hypothetical protein